MKKFIYIFSLLAILFTGCQTNEIVLEEPTSENGKRTITFSMNIPDFQVKSRAESPISNIQLMTFGEDGYIETVRATNIGDIKEEGETPVGAFSAAIDRATTVVHFIANYGKDLSATPGADEDDVIPSLTASTENIVYWARNEISFEETSIHVNFLRHVAKVTVEVSDEVIDGYAANTYFKVTGFAICQYVAQGTIAPNNYEWGYKTNADGTITETPTEVGIGTTTPATFPTTNPDELYLAECSNQKVQEDQVYVIIAGQLKSKNNNDEWNVNGEWEQSKYYKVLLTDPNDNPFKIIRNVNYKVVIKQMQDVGVTSFEEAKSSNPINNLYAYVMAESPSISDMDGYTLTVTPIVHLLTAAGSFKSLVSVSKPSTSADDRELQYSGPTGDDILRDISLSTGELTGNVAAVEELKKSQIRVTYGKLSRTVTVIASPQFTIEAQAYSDPSCTTVKSSYQAADEDVYFKFNLDTDYPSATDYPDLYPIKCYIKADNLYPVDNKDMLIDYEYKAEQYWYTYLAESTGDHIIHFKTKISTIDEIIEIESAYFGSDAVELTGKELPFAITNASLSPTTVSLGTNQTVTLTFNMNKVKTITLNATRLTYVSSSTGTITTNNDGTISYTPTVKGNQTITFKTADAVRGGTLTISHTDISNVELDYSRASIGNKTVTGNNQPNGDINIMNIYYNDTSIGTCKYESNGDRLENITFNYTGNLTNDMEIVIIGTRSYYTYTINTTIGNLISNNSNLTLVRSY